MWLGVVSMCLHLKWSTGRGQDFPITLKSPHATSLLITIISNKLPDKNPLSFCSSVKATCKGRLLRLRSGCQSRRSLGGTRSLPGGRSPQETPPLQGTGTSLALRFWRGITSKAMPHRRGVCRDVRPLQTKLSADFHTAHCLPFAHLDSANSLTHPRVSHALLGHAPSAWSCVVSARCPSRQESQTL